MNLTPQAQHITSPEVSFEEAKALICKSLSCAADLTKAPGPTRDDARPEKGDPIYSAVLKDDWKIPEKCGFSRINRGKIMQNHDEMLGLRWVGIWQYGLIGIILG